MDFLIFLLVLAIAHKTGTISDRAYENAHVLISIICLIVIVIILSMFLTKCSTAL